MHAKKSAKKSLGQHFLKSRAAIDKIAAAAEVHPDDVVLEIGPGTGILTRVLLDKAGKVTAVEKDKELSKALLETFREEAREGRLDVISGDILDFDPKTLSSYKLIGNIPYYITGAIIEKFLTEENQPERMVFLVQKEVAERIAKDKKGSILSMSVRAYGEPKYIKTVPAKYFSPPPKVDSAILLIENISRARFENISEEHFFSVLKLGFAHKRKQLRGNLTNAYLPEQVTKALESLSLSPKVRAEDLSIDMWFSLSEKLE